MRKFILFVSAFVPMYLLFLINLLLEIMNDNLTFNVTNTILVVCLIFLILFGTFGLFFVIGTGGEKGEKIKIVSKKNITDQHFLNYFSLFVLLAFTFDLSKISYIITLVTILFFIGIVYIKNNIYYVNPLFNILGYSFYDITYIDNSGLEKETRIFYKGELKINKEYKLFSSSRNLNFVDNYE